MDYYMEAQESKYVECTDLISKDSGWKIKVEKDGYFATRGHVCVFYTVDDFYIEHYGKDVETQYEYVMSDIANVEFKPEYLQVVTKSGIHLIVPTC